MSMSRRDSHSKCVVLRYSKTMRMKRRVDKFWSVTTRELSFYDLNQKLKGNFTQVSGWVGNEIFQNNSNWVVSLFVQWWCPNYFTS